MSKMRKTVGLIPFVLVAFINAFTDLGHKIIIQNSVYKVYDGDIQVILTAIVNALILLPYILLFTPASFLANKYSKNLIMRYAAWLAVGVTLGITVAYYMGWFWIAFGFTFLLALQSAIYSPAKYGYIKELMGVGKLTVGNAIIQSTTMVAILSGIIVYTIFFELSMPYANITDMALIMESIAPLGWLLVLGSLIEVGLTYRLTTIVPTDKELTFDSKKYHNGAYLRENMAVIRHNKTVWFTIMALSMFWAISQVVLATFPAYIKEVSGELNTMLVQGAMALAGIGVILGSIVAGRMSRGKIETGIVPIGALGLVVTTGLITYLDGLTLWSLNFLAFGFFGGLLVVPLNALMQFHAPLRSMGTVIAGNNFVQNIAMFSFLMLTVGLAWMGVHSQSLLIMMAFVALAMMLLTLIRLPQSLFRMLLGALVVRRYRINVLHAERIPSQGGVLLLGNHISWIDWAVLSLASNRPIHFVMERAIYERWQVKWFLDFFDVIPVSSRAAKEAKEQVQERLNDGQVVCIFPEGTISRNGNLSEFKRGFENFAQGTNAIIIPFYMRGLWGSRFSRASGKVRSNTRTGFKRDLVVAFGRKMAIDSDANRVKQEVFRLSFATWKEYAQTLRPVPYSWLSMAKRLGSDLSVADTLGTVLSNTRFITATFLFANAIKRLSPHKYVGIMLPTTAGGLLANMATLSNGQVACNLNYTAGEAAIRAAIAKANIKHLFTARAFADKLKERGLIVENLSDVVTIHYAEDIKASFSKAKSLWTLLQAKFLPAFVLEALYMVRIDINDVAAIMFSSGSEGEPKGVELTHKNFMVNIKQITDVINSEDDDVMMAMLPLFHSMGLTVNALKPLVEGMPVVCHPDPTDAESIGKAVAKYQATIILGTSTFYRIYTRSKKVLPIMFESLRLVVAGAEKLSNDVRREFREKFGKEMFEGYGVTETTPVSGVNLPDRLDSDAWQVQLGQKTGTVGLPLPGTAYKIVDPDTLEELPFEVDGLILIGGEQVMRGYLEDPKRTQESIVEREGLRWYKTGDKGHLDSDGFLTIVDRYSRFAKLGGEMVSLGALESEIRDIVEGEEVDIAATALPDPKKGERVILLLAGEMTPTELRRRILEAKINPLSIPDKIYSVEAIPKLGSGKSNFPAIKTLALECVNGEV
ncbi:MAG: 2-acyl-glycerophospho-ethanolamine acyltransferase [Sulfuricurvum sp. PC08-66]|nr:MAG: 2-acyl-glycerophospho-ethanolamine acyltransferase [Sulfuricurvum sp. PC08-66]